MFILILQQLYEVLLVGAIVGGLLAVAGLLLWTLRRPLRVAADSAQPRRSQLGWGLSLIALAWILAIKLATPEFFTNAYGNELADNGWLSFVAAAGQNRLDYRQFYATRPDAEVMADLKPCRATAASLPAPVRQQRNRSPTVGSASPMSWSS